MLAAADEDGVSAIRVGPQWVQVASALTSPALANQDDGGNAIWVATRDHAFAKASMGDRLTNLRGLRLDQADAFPMLAPFTIYPFDPWTCARLTCDLLTFESTLAWDRLSNAFVSQGFETECLLPNSNDPLDWSVSVMTARRKEGAVTLHGVGMSQILLELVDLRTYVLGIRELFSRKLQAPSGVLVFANERTQWK